MSENVLELRVCSVLCFVVYCGCVISTYKRECERCKFGLPNQHQMHEACMRMAWAQTDVWHVGGHLPHGFVTPLHVIPNRAARTGTCACITINTGVSAP